MSLTRIEGDVQVTGQFFPQTIVQPAGSISDASVAVGAGIQASKLQHEHRKEYSQEASANNVNETRAVWTARFSGSVVDFRVGLTTPPNTAAGSGGRTVTLDLKKNGTTILSSVVTLNSTNVSLVTVAGTIITAGYVAGDVFQIVDANAGGSTGTFPLGVFAQVTFNESGS